MNGPVTIDQLDPAKLEEAIEAAKNSDVAIVFAGSNRDYETEASDRRNLNLPFGQEELIKKMGQANKSVTTKSKSQLSPVYKKLEDKLASHLSAKVELQHQKNGSGKITIAYTDLNSLNKILEAMQVTIS